VARASACSIGFSRCPDESEDVGSKLALQAKEFAEKGDP